MMKFFQDGVCFILQEFYHFAYFLSGFRTECILDKSFDGFLFTFISSSKPGNFSLRYCRFVLSKRVLLPEDFRDMVGRLFCRSMVQSQRHSRHQGRVCRQGGALRIQARHVQPSTAGLSRPCSAFGGSLAIGWKKEDDGTAIIATFRFRQ